MSVQQRPVYLTGVGGALPPYRYTSVELAPYFNVDEETALRYEKATGVQARHSLVDFPDGRRQKVLNEDIASEAATVAMGRAHVSADDIDTVITASSMFDYLLPTIGSRLLKRLGIREAMTFDLYGGCAQFMYGVVQAVNFIGSGMCDTVVVTASESLTTFGRHFRHPVDAFIFGDAAGAWVLSSKVPDAIDDAWEVHGTTAATRSEFEGEPTEVIIMPITGNKEEFDFYLDPDPTCDPRIKDLPHDGRGDEYRWIHNTKLARKLASFGMIEGLKRVVGDWDTNDGIVIPHQGTLPVLKDTAERMPDGWEPIVNIQERGNLSTACIPMAFHDHYDRVKQAPNVVCSSVGVGFSFAAAHLTPLHSI